MRFQILQKSKFCVIVKMFSFYAKHRAKKQHSSNFVAVRHAGVPGVDAVVAVAACQAFGTGAAGGRLWGLHHVRKRDARLLHDVVVA